MLEGLQYVGEVGETALEAQDGVGRGLVVGRGHARARPRESAPEIEGPRREVLDEVGDRRGRWRRPAGSREDGGGVREGVEALLGRALGGGEEAGEAARRVGRERVDARGLAQPLLERLRRGGELAGEPGLELAALELEVERRAQPAEQLEARLHPRGRATERGGDRRRVVAAVEEEADQPRLLERAHGPPRGVEREAQPGRRAVVELEHDRPHLAPAQRVDGLVAEVPVDQLEGPDVERPHHERAAEADGADARRELVDARQVAEYGRRRRDDPADLEQDGGAHGPSPSRARIAATDCASPPRGSSLVGATGRTCHTPSGVPVRQGRCATKPSASSRASARSSASRERPSASAMRSRP
jgi:hypothetical protein